MVVCKYLERCKILLEAEPEDVAEKPGGASGSKYRGYTNVENFFSKQSYTKGGFFYFFLFSRFVTSIDYPLAEIMDP